MICSVVVVGSNPWMALLRLSASSCAGAKSAPPHQGPLLLDHRAGVSFGESLDLFSLGFGKLLCERVDPCEVRRLGLHHHPSGVVVVQDEEGGKPYYNAEEDVEPPVDDADGGVVRFAPLYGYQALRQGHPHRSEQRAQQDGQEEEDRRERVLQSLSPRL